MGFAKREPYFCKKLKSRPAESMKKDLVAKKQVSTKSKLQKRYEKLLQDIEDNQAARKNLEEGMKMVVPRIQGEIRPLMSERDALMRKRLLRLDELADELGIGKYNQEWFDEYMIEQTGELMNRVGFGDEELKNVFEKYAGESILPDEETMAPMAQRFRDEFGIDVDLKEMMDMGVDNFLNEHDEEIRKKMFEKQEAEDAEEMNNFDPSAKKKVSKQQQALMQDAKAIYLRLVKKNHPDREPDEAAKAQKTELIQRVTNAYQENDFLTLLKLQIEYLEEEETDASFLAEDMLKRYNKILQKQLNEIKQEIDYLKYSSMGMYEDFFGVGDKFSERKFKNFKKKLRGEIELIQEDLNDSNKRKKGWFKDRIKAIKAYQQEMMQNNFFQFFDI